MTSTSLPLPGSDPSLVLFDVGVIERAGTWVAGLQLDCMTSTITSYFGADACRAIAANLGPALLLAADELDKLNKPKSTLIVPPAPKGLITP